MTQIAVRYWLEWWRGNKGVGPYRRDAFMWYATLSFLRR